MEEKNFSDFENIIEKIIDFNYNYKYEFNSDAEFVKTLEWCLYQSRKEIENIEEVFSYINEDYMNTADPSFIDKNMLNKDDYTKDKIINYVNELDDNIKYSMYKLFLSLLVIKNYKDNNIKIKGE